MDDFLEFHRSVRAALNEDAPVVALESTVLAHGLPWPENIDTVRAMCAAIEGADAVPAVIALHRGRVRIGLDEITLERFARGSGIAKASRRDLAPLLSHGADGATTAAGTMACAALAGIEVMATGGIGGVHRGDAGGFDVSADLTELGRTPVTVVCSGAKSILDLRRTLEMLETQGVPVIGYRVDRVPAFHIRDSGLPVSGRADSATEVARIIRRQRSLGGGGLLVTNPVPARAALEAAELEEWIAGAQAEADEAGISGKELTPFLLRRLAELSGGRTLSANRALLVENARLAARVAAALVADPA